MFLFDAMSESVVPILSEPTASVVRDRGKKKNLTLCFFVHSCFEIGHGLHPEIFKVLEQINDRFGMIVGKKLER